MLAANKKLMTLTVMFQHPFYLYLSRNSYMNTAKKGRGLTEEWEEPDGGVGLFPSMHRGGSKGQQSKLFK